MRSAPTVDVISVIDRIALVLACFDADDDRLGISELARRAGLPKSTVSRLVSELVEHRYLERDSGGVRLGLRLFELGQLATQPRALRALAVEAMADLRDEIGQTVQLAVLDGGDRVCLGVLHSRAASRRLPRAGERSPAHASAAGRVLLAFAATATAEALTGRNVLERTGTATLENEMADIRARGVAFDVDPQTGRVVGVAAIVLAAQGEPVAAIAASAGADPFEPWLVTPAVRTAAAEIGRLAS